MPKPLSTPRLMRPCRKNLNFVTALLEGRKKGRMISGKKVLQIQILAALLGGKRGQSRFSKRVDGRGVNKRACPPFPDPMLAA
jgi:hypothetical protein